jgi:hypothetical protein
MLEHVPDADVPDAGPDEPELLQAASPRASATAGTATDRRPAQRLCLDLGFAKLIIVISCFSGRVTAIFLLISMDFEEVGHGPPLLRLADYIVLSFQNYQLIWHRTSGRQCSQRPARGSAERAARRDAQTMTTESEDAAR